MDTITGAMARFCVGLDLARLPAPIIEKARVCLFNAYGIGMNGLATPYAPVARTAALALDGQHRDGATMLGDGRRTAIGGACLANSALFHGRAQEDTCGAAHFGTIIIPLLTAMIEVRRYPLEDLIPALVAGYEAGGLLEQAFAGATTPAGFRSSAIYGHIAAAAAAARLMRLDEARFAAALANAVSLAGGVLQSFADGTDEWRYQVGVAARNGLLAAELAHAGSISAPDAIEGRSGLAAAFARMAPPVDLGERLGRDWALTRVSFKPFPVCAFNQTPVMAALELRARMEGMPPPVSVTVRMNPYEAGYAGMDAMGPFHSISGTLMSIPFCIATTLVHGEPSMAAMTTYDDEAVNRLVARTRLVADEQVPTLCAVIEVVAADGRRFVQEQNMTPADYAYDMPTVSALLRRIGREEGVDDAAFDRLEAFVRGLPDGDIADVIAVFPAAHAAGGN